VPAASVSIPVKNVGAFGEAGAVVTDNAPAAGKILTLRDHDQIRKYRHSMIGWNRRTNGIQTAVLGVKSRHLETGNALRRRHVLGYDAASEAVRTLLWNLSLHASS
jgi:dTDP-4-amino-4,6-dideoxygalactose transaminase